MTRSKTSPFFQKLEKRRERSKKGGGERAFTGGSLSKKTVKYREGTIKIRRVWEKR